MKPMTKIIGFTGAQGTGKSTVLEAIRTWAAHNSHQTTKIIVDTHSVSRQAQLEIDKTSNLAAIVSDAQKVMDLQNAIRETKKAHIQKLLTENPDADFIFTDRSPVDFMAYAKLWMSEADIPTELEEETFIWLKRYLKSCAQDTVLYDMIVYFPTGVIPFVSEVARGSEATQLQHAQHCKLFLTFMSLPSFHVTESLVDFRRNEILKAVGITAL
jgi:predicted ATPase